MTLVGAGLGTFLAACGDDDDVTPGPKTDSGVDSTPGTDGSPADTGTDAPQTVDAGTPAKIILVHAATSLGPNTDQTGAYGGGVRVCFSTKTASETAFSPTPFPALPSDGGGASPYPGLFIGTGGPFSTSGADLETLTVRPYLMNAKALNEKGIVGQDPSVPRCGKLLTDGGIGDDPANNLEPNVDFWQLADIPAGTLKKEKTYILAVTGCTSDAEDVTLGFCGNGDNGQPFAPDGTPGIGNLKILVVEVDAATGVAADEIGAAALNLSPQQAALKAVVGPFKPTLANAEFLDGGDGADAAGGKFAVTANFDELNYNRGATATSPVAKIKGLVTATGYFALAPTAGASESLAGPLKLNNQGGTPPATVQALTTGNVDPAAQQLYVNGQSYTFVLVGEPGLPPTQGTRGLHYLGFPNKQ
ncbi:MAG: hypothetical protein KF764_32090 [Labilithrix sp.]|nr:hypothetical protein [Labilithrix sp.]